MTVRPATRADLLDIARVAEAAQWSSYGDLLSPLTVAALLQRDFSPSILRRRLLGGGMHVAEEHGRVVGAVSGTVADGTVHLDSLVTDPHAHLEGVAAALVSAVRDSCPSLPLCVDVLLGNDPAESFFEAAGFVPGEVLETTVLGETLIERRWWLSSAWGATG